MSGEISHHPFWEFLEESDIAFLSAFTSLSISCVTFQMIEFGEMLKMFPNLANVDLFSVRLPKAFKDDQHENRYERPHFENLKQLTFSHETDSRLLRCFTNAKLTTFICREQQFTTSDIWEFLISQNDLKEIDFYRTRTSSAIWMLNIQSAVNFFLNKITLDYKTIVDFDGIMDLLSNQPSSIQTVELDHIPDNWLYSTIFADLKNLKNLHFMPGRIEVSLSHDLLLEPLLSVTSLRVYDGANYGFNLKSIEEATIKIIENSPNLEHLELLVPYNEIYYQLIVKHLKKLKRLTIRVTFDTELKHLEYPPVQQLRINCFYMRVLNIKHRPISMVEESKIQETVKSLIYDGFTDQVFVDFTRKIFPMLELLQVRKDSAYFEHSQVAGIRHVNKREKDFFAHSLRSN